MDEFVWQQFIRGPWFQDALLRCAQGTQGAPSSFVPAAELCTDAANGTFALAGMVELLEGSLHWCDLLHATYRLVQQCPSRQALAIEFTAHACFDLLNVTQSLSDYPNLESRHRHVMEAPPRRSQEF